MQVGSLLKGHKLTATLVWVEHKSGRALLSQAASTDRAKPQSPKMLSRVTAGESALVISPEPAYVHSQGQILYRCKARPFIAVSIREVAQDGCYYVTLRAW